MMGHHEENLTLDARSGVETLYVGHFLPTQLPQDLNLSKKQQQEMLIKWGSFRKKRETFQRNKGTFCPTWRTLSPNTKKSANSLFALFYFTAAVGLKM